MYGIMGYIEDDVVFFDFVGDLRYVFFNVVVWLVYISLRILLNFLI